MTAVETRVWEALRNSRTGHKFRRQFPVGTYVLDFYCAAARLAIEIDGPFHEEQRDASRDAQIGDVGILVLRYTTERVAESFDEVILDILLQCEQRNSYLTRKAKDNLPDG